MSIRDCFDTFVFLFSDVIPKKISKRALLFVFLACTLTLCRGYLSITSLSITNINKFETICNEGCDYKIDIPKPFVAIDTKNDDYWSFAIPKERISLNLTAERYYSYDQLQQILQKNQDLQTKNAEKGTVVTDSNDNIRNIRLYKKCFVSYELDSTKIHYIVFLLNENYLCKCELIYPDTYNDIFEDCVSSNKKSCCETIKNSFATY